jgi:hypothetical protein
LEKNMARAKASSGITDYAVSIVAGHHQLAADENIERRGKDSGPSASELVCARPLAFRYMVENVPSAWHLISEHWRVACILRTTESPNGSFQILK